MTGSYGEGVPAIDTDAQMISREIESVGELASNPAMAKDGSRIYSFNIKWGALMSGRLKRLEHYYRARELSPEQERRYRDLRRELKEAMPMIEELGITRPTVSLED